MNMRIYLKINKLSKRINTVIERISINLKDNFIKDRKTIIFIRSNPLILSMIVVLIGLLFVSITYINLSKTKQNTLIINTEEATEVTLNYNENMTNIQVNPSEDLPYFMQIIIDADYEEPVMRDSIINLNKICINTKRSQNEKLPANLNKINLFLSNQIFSYTNKGFNSAYFNLNYPILSTCYKYDESLVLVEPDTDGEYSFSYNLDYTDNENRIFNLKGKAKLANQIKGADEIDEMNIRINKSILLLTGWLIVLGSVPFSHSLKQLLDD